MNDGFSSIFAVHIPDFLATKRASGYTYESGEYFLRNFDRYCCVHTKGTSLSRELVFAWAKAKDKEQSGSHRARISPVREFGKYLQSIGISDAFVLPTALHRKIERYVPHFFTACELSSFFMACDGLKAHAAMHARHLVLPVFFRLLYCCGLRTCEARTLRVENVDLQCGQIDIIASKGSRSRRIPVSRDLQQLFRRYDACVSEIYPGRVYFFPTTRSECYARSSIGSIFHDIWIASGLGQGCGNRPRAYDFRHHFALKNLNRWIIAGVDVDVMLPYLSKYMGHSCIESTDYYLHLVPEFFHTFCEKVSNTQTLLPEVAHGEE